MTQKSCLWGRPGEATLGVGHLGLRTWRSSSLLQAVWQLVELTVQSTDFGAGSPGFESWLSCSVAVWPPASCFPSLSLSLPSFSDGGGDGFCSQCCLTSRVIVRISWGLLVSVSSSQGHPEWGHKTILNGLGNEWLRGQGLEREEIWPLNPKPYNLFEDFLSPFSLHHDVTQSHIRGHINLLEIILQRTTVTLKYFNYIHYPSYLQWPGETASMDRKIQYQAVPDNEIICSKNFHSITKLDWFRLKSNRTDLFMWLMN